MKTIYLDSTTLRGKEGWVWPCSVYGESTVQTRYLQSPGFHFYSFDLSGISCPFKTCIHPCRYIYTYRSGGENTLSVHEAKVSRTLVNKKICKYSIPLMELPSLHTPFHSL